MGEFTDLLCGLVSVHVRHIDVHNDQLGVVFPAERHRLASVPGMDELVFLLQDRLEQQEVALIVLGHEDRDLLPAQRDLRRLPGRLLRLVDRCRQVRDREPERTAAALARRFDADRSAHFFDDPLTDG